MASDEVMDIEGLSRYLKLAPITLYKMVKQGKIPHKRIGKSLRFPKETIDQWLKEGSKREEMPSPIKEAVSEFASRLRRGLQEHIKDIRLFGSWARNEARIDSDIDIAVLVDKKDLKTVKKTSQIASDVSLQTDRFLSVTVMELASHRRGIEQGYPFHKRIDSEGIPI